MRFKYEHRTHTHDNRYRNVQSHHIHDFKRAMIEALAIIYAFHFPLVFLHTLCIACEDQDLKPMLLSIVGLLFTIAVHP
jgi:hypothetical protein